MRQAYVRTVHAYGNPVEEAVLEYVRSAELGREAFQAMRDPGEYGCQSGDLSLRIDVLVRPGSYRRRVRPEKKEQQSLRRPQTAVFPELCELNVATADRENPVKVGHYEPRVGQSPAAQ